MHAVYVLVVLHNYVHGFSDYVLMHHGLRHNLSANASCLRKKDYGFHVSIYGKTAAAE